MSSQDVCVPKVCYSRTLNSKGNDYLWVLILKTLADFILALFISQKVNIIKTS